MFDLLWLGLIVIDVISDSCSSKKSKTAKIEDPETDMAVKEVIRSTAKDQSVKHVKFETVC